MASRLRWLLAIAALLPSAGETNENFEVRLLSRDAGGLSQLPVAALSPLNRRTRMRTASGAPFTCFVPPPASGASSGAPPEDSRSMRAAAAAAALASSASRCVTKRSGPFWTVEVCAGLHARQFRATQVLGSGSGGAGAELAAGQPISASVPLALSDEETAIQLGTFGTVREGGGAGAGAGASDDAAVAGSGSEERGSSLGASATGALALRQLLRGGTDGRATLVQWLCDPPGMEPGALVDIVSVTEQPPLNYSIVVGTREPAVCELLPSPQWLVAALNQTCFEHVEGWWTYEVCFGLHLRQFHAEQGSGKPVQESLIGAYDWARGEQLAPAGVGTAPAVVQHYEKGTACDIRNAEPREAFVRFECAPSVPTGTGDAASASTQGRAAPVAFVTVGPNQLSLLSIREAPSCVYTITIGSALVCDHPDVSQSMPVVALPPPVTIYCVEEDSTSHDDGEELNDDESLN